MWNSRVEHRESVIVWRWWLRYVFLLHLMLDGISKSFYRARCSVSIIDMFEDIVRFFQFPLLGRSWRNACLLGRCRSVTLAVLRSGLFHHSLISFGSALCQCGVQPLILCLIRGPFADNITFRSNLVKINLVIVSITSVQTEKKNVSLCR